MRTICDRIWDRNVFEKKHVFITAVFFSDLLSVAAQTVWLVVITGTRLVPADTMLSGAVVGLLTSKCHANLIIHRICLCNATCPIPIPYVS